MKKQNQTKKIRTDRRVIHANTIDIRKKKSIKNTVWKKYQQGLDAAIADRKAKEEHKEMLIAMLKKGRAAGITLKQLGTIFGVSRERIRQLLAKKV